MDRKFPLRRYPHDTTLALAFDSDDAILAYCAEEVRRQGDTPWHVWRMWRAWKFAMGQYSHDIANGLAPRLTHGIVREIGRIIDEENPMGYRTCQVWVGSELKCKPDEIHAAMTELLDEQFMTSPIDFYARFEEIHPFVDGNGRTGKVLYNWRRGSLVNPVWPRDLYGGIENP